MTKIFLDDNEKKNLLAIAREALRESARRGRFPSRIAKEADSRDLSEHLMKNAGAFVSLHKKGKLRGCIGRFEADEPLYQTVIGMAYAASQNDPRFSAITEEEVDDTDIEISVLTPMRRIEDASEIEIGRHGIYLIKGARRGTLLPQVATQYGWDRETFLEQTCVKAGLPKTAWKDDDTEMYIYDAIVFGEKEEK